MERECHNFLQEKAQQLAVKGEENSESNHARLTLTDRDTAMLIMAFSYAGVGINHLSKRFFSNEGQRSTACYARINKLIKAGYFSSKRLPSLEGVGSGPMLLFPDSAARPVLAKALGFSRAELGRFRMDSPFQMSHHLSICDIRLSIEMACEQSNAFTLREVLADHELKNTPIRVNDPKTKEILSIVPDAIFNLALPNGKEQSLYLELDMGTMTSAERMKKRLRAYMLYEKENLSPVLFVVPSENRKGLITRYVLEEAEKLGGADPKIFLFAVKDSIDEKTVLSAPIWQVAGENQAVSLADYTLTISDLVSHEEQKNDYSSESNVNNSIKQDITCKETPAEEQSTDQEILINNGRIDALMHRYHANREAPSSIQEALEQRVKIMNEFLRYLPFVPVGKSNQNYIVDQEIRLQIFNERGCICEACLKKIEDQKFELNHTNYYKGNDPEYLKIVCQPCHNIINMLTGVISWFEEKTQKPKTKKESSQRTTVRIAYPLENVQTQPTYTRLFRSGKNENESQES